MSVWPPLKSVSVPRYDEFTKTVEEWHTLKAKAIELKRAELADRLNEADEKLKKHSLPKLKLKS